MREDKKKSWIALHRQLLYSPIFDNPELLKVWIWCLLKASYDDKKTIIGLSEVTLKRGEFIFGRESAARYLRQKPTTVYKRMKLLEQCGNINIKSNNKYSIVSVKNWDTYQFTKEDMEQLKEQQKDNKGTTKGQQRNTNNKDNKEKKDNKYSEEFEKLWSEYPKRDGKKAAQRHFFASIKTDDNLSDIKKALSNYKKYIAANNTQTKYIKAGSTWFNNWQDWIDNPDINDKELDYQMHIIENM